MLFTERIGLCPELRRDADATGGIALVYAGDLTSWIGFICTNGVDRDGGASLRRIPRSTAGEVVCRFNINNLSEDVTHRSRAVRQKFWA